MVVPFGWLKQPRGREHPLIRRHIPAPAASRIGAIVSGRGTSVASMTDNHHRCQALGAYRGKRLTTESHVGDTSPMTHAAQVIGTVGIQRSAHGVMAATPTTAYLGVCDLHQLPVKEIFDGEQHTQFSMITCFHDPDGEHQIKGERLIGVETTLDCDGSCRSARRPKCACGCGGINHGDHWTRQYKLDYAEMYESEVLAYRAEMRKLEDKREVRRMAKEARKREEFEVWAVDHAPLINWLRGLLAMGERNNFVKAMAEKTLAGEILSERMVAVCRDIFRERRERAEKNAAAEQQQEVQAVKPGVGDQARLEVGVYKLGSDVYVLKGNQTWLRWRKAWLKDDSLPRPDSARLYAKKLVQLDEPKIVRGQEIHFELVYAAGVVFRIAPEDKMSLTEAVEWAKFWKQCLACGLPLSADKSVDQAIGSTCVKYFGPMIRKD
jgi:hypothetical protein